MYGDGDGLDVAWKGGERRACALTAMVNSAGGRLQRAATAGINNAMQWRRRLKEALDAISGRCERLLTTVAQCCSGDGNGVVTIGLERAAR